MPEYVAMINRFGGKMDARRLTAQKEPVENLWIDKLLVRH